MSLIFRYNCTEDKVDTADIIIPIGGDGTYLLASSRVRNNKKPVIGFNSDPSRSEGCLCLPRWCSMDVKKTLEKLQQVCSFSFSLYKRNCLFRLFSSYIQYSKVLVLRSPYDF